MRKVIAVPFLALALTSPAAAQQFGSGDWAASKIGQTCYVFTVRSARDTSGALVFSFEQQGFNANFSYEYAPWPGETGAPWGQDDYVVLEVDGEETWLGDEMFPLETSSGYGASITSGFVAEMIGEISGASNSVGYSMNLQAQGETVLFGLFSVAGFEQSMAQAGQWCQFDPKALPES